MLVDSSIFGLFIILFFVLVFHIDNCFFQTSFHSFVFLINSFFFIKVSMKISKIYVVRIKEWSTPAGMQITLFSIMKWMKKDLSHQWGVQCKKKNTCLNLNYMQREVNEIISIKKKRRLRWCWIIVQKRNFWNQG